MSHAPPVNPESVRLMNALLSRPDAASAARDALRRAYPDAPQAMIDTAAFHVATDGIAAAVDWLAAVERFLTSPAAGLDYGATWHLLYHLYNWQQFEALLPIGRAGLLERLNDARVLLESEDDKDAALHVIQGLLASFGGGLTPPKVE
jgi:hypothetical protein